MNKQLDHSWPGISFEFGDGILGESKISFSECWKERIPLEMTVLP